MAYGHTEVIAAPGTFSSEILGHAGRYIAAGPGASTCALKLRRRAVQSTSRRMVASPGYSALRLDLAEFVSENIFPIKQRSVPVIFPNKPPGI